MFDQLNQELKSSLRNKNSALSIITKNYNKRFALIPDHW